VVLRLQRLPVLSKRQGLAAAGLAFLLPAVHPVLRPLVGVPSHLLWFAHGLPVAVATYLFGVRGAVGAILLSIGAVSGGERLFGAGYGRGSDDATILALSAAVAFTDALVAAFALAVRREQAQRRSLEAQFLQAQKMEAIGRLAGGIAHDFNNLLTAILGTTQLALADMAATDPVRADLEEIQRAGERAARLTRQLLAVSRKQVVSPGPLDLNALVADLRHLLQRLIGEDIELRTATEPDLGWVLADRGQLEQLIMNLVVNARDAMPHGGRLLIQTANAELDAYAACIPKPVEPGRYVMVAVSDTGVGMTAETKAHLFEPFFTTKGPGRGTGLGLATVYGIVRQSRGYLWVYSEVGRGTTFKIYLPRTDRPAESGPAPAAAPRESRGSETVLVVEDDEAVRNVAGKMLRSLGYRVLTAADGAAALRWLEQGVRPDVLVSDVLMPGMTGPELAAEVQRLHPAVRIMYVSGHMDDPALHRHVRTPGVAVLPKPFTADAIAQAVRELLDGPAAAIAAHRP
jgi:signal transduction histidine kinase/ActR/RegA family two-component response regulator